MVGFLSGRFSAVGLSQLAHLTYQILSTSAADLQCHRSVQCSVSSQLELHTISYTIGLTVLYFSKCISHNKLKTQQPSHKFHSSCADPEVHPENSEFSEIRNHSVILYCKYIITFIKFKHKLLHLIAFNIVSLLLFYF